VGRAVRLEAETAFDLTDFLCMAIPHRDHVLIGTALGPNNDHHATVKPARRDPADFAIIEPIVNPCCTVAREHLGSIGNKVDAPMLEGPCALGWDRM
jgi:hypothetical protein